MITVATIRAVARWLFEREYGQGLSYPDQTTRNRFLADAIELLDLIVREAHREE